MLIAKLLSLHDHCSVVEMMFQCASGNPVDWEGHQNARPLHAACECSHLKIVETLIEHGANLEAKNEKDVKKKIPCISS